MGMTTVAYKGRSLEGNDNCLALWLALLVDEIDKLPEVPAWLHEARDHWDLHATQRFDFGVMPDLDDHVADDGPRDTVLELCGQALARLRAFGDPIPVSVLNSIPLSPPNQYYPRDVPSRLFVATAEYFIHLLDGCPLERAWKGPAVADADTREGGTSL